MCMSQYDKHTRNVVSALVNLIFFFLQMPTLIITKSINFYENVYSGKLKTLANLTLFIDKHLKFRGYGGNILRHILWFAACTLIV